MRALIVDFDFSLFWGASSSAVSANELQPTTGNRPLESPTSSYPSTRQPSLEEQDIGVTNPVPYNASSLDTVILETPPSHEDVESHWRSKENLISTDMPASASPRVNADSLPPTPGYPFPVRAYPSLPRRYGPFPPIPRHSHGAFRGTWG